MRHIFTTQIYAWSLAVLVAVLFVPLTVQAQTGAIEGQVFEARNGQPLPGVSVVIPSLNTGAATDVNGQYEIPSVPVGEYEVRVSFVGYKTQSQIAQVAADEVVVLNFEMETDALGLDEVVVTGTGGAVEKKRLGNTISTVNTEDLQNSPIANVSELMQGREPGVQGIAGSGMAGQGSKIRIRGSSSLSQSNEPVVYIDGIRSNNGGGFAGLVGTGGSGTPSRLDDINPEAIERIEILKGAAAATLFGSEASNGVIQIFTKRGGVSQAPSFTLGIEQGITRAPERRFTNQTNFVQTQDQVDVLSQVTGEEVRLFEMRSHNAITDMFETGRLQTYSASVSGGSEVITYYASGRFTAEDGPLKVPDGLTGLVSDDVLRGQGTVNIGIFPTETSRIRVTALYSEVDFSTHQNSNNIFGTLAVASGSQPNRVTKQSEYGGILFASLEETMQQTVDQETQRFSGSVNANINPIEFLSLDATFGVDFTSTFGEEVNPFGWNVDGVVGSNTEGRRAIADTRNLELTLDTKALLDNEIGDNITSSLTVGSQGFITRRTTASVAGVAFPGPGFNIVNAGSQFDREETFREIVQIGLFAQEQVGFNNYIFATAGVRLDANSAFGSDFSTVTYPKVSLSVVPSDAAFWAGPVGPLSSLRLRAAVGQSGLQPGAFDALTTFGPLAAPGRAGIVPDNLGNDDLQPEIATEWEVGTEMGLFADRLAVEATYWDRTVSDALVARQFPPTGGFRGSQLINVGETKGRGGELGVNVSAYNSQTLSVDVFANASYLWEQVTDLGDAPPIKAAGSYPRVRNFVTEGFAPGTHFGAALMDVPEGFLPVDIVNGGDGEPDSKEALVAYLSGLTPENARLPENTTQVLLSQDGNPDLAAPLNHYLGKPWPDWSGSFGVDVSFLDFSLSTMFEYKAGNYFVNNLDGAFRKRNTAIGRNTPLAAETTRNYWTGGLDESLTPQNSGQVRLQALETWLNDLLGLAPFSGLNHIERADHIRWRELSLSYDVPTRFVTGFGAENVTLSLAGRNLYLWTTAGYTGQDPETNTFGRGASTDQFDNNFREGIEAWNVPLPRRVTFKLRATF